MPQKESVRFAGDQLLRTLLQFGQELQKRQQLEQFNQALQGATQPVYGGQAPVDFNRNVTPPNATLPTRSVGPGYQGGGPGTSPIENTQVGSQLDLRALLPVLLRMSPTNPVAKDYLGGLMATQPKHQFINQEGGGLQMATIPPIGDPTVKQITPSQFRSGAVTYFDDVDQATGQPKTVTRDGIVYKTAKGYQLTPNGYVEVPNAVRFQKVRDADAFELSRERLGLARKSREDVERNRQNTDFKFWNQKKIDLEKRLQDLGLQVTKIQNTPVSGDDQTRQRDELVSDIQLSINELQETYQFVQSKVKDTTPSARNKPPKATQDPLGIRTP